MLCMPKYAVYTYVHAWLASYHCRLVTSVRIVLHCRVVSVVEVYDHSSSA